MEKIEISKEKAEEIMMVLRMIHTVPSLLKHFNSTAILLDKYLHRKINKIN